MLTMLFAAAMAAAVPQEPDAPAAPAQQEALRVFLDCRTWCDFDYIRREITFVSWVRDQADGQLVVLVTDQPTGGGGRSYTLFVRGQRSLAGRSDTLTYSTSRTDTPDEVRSGLTQTLKLVLVRYAAGTPLAAQIRITHAAPRAVPVREQRDAWNYWVFRVGVNGNVGSEERSSSNAISGSFSANRTTETWKIRVDGHGRRSRSSFRTSDTTSFVSRQHNWSVNTLVVGSLGDHWSAGFRSGVSASTFVNQDLRLRLAPAVEYNFFRYAESSRRQLTVQYAVGLERFDYADTTLFGRTEETLTSHSLDVSLQVQQPWGGVFAGVDASQYLGRPSKYSLRLSSSGQVRLVRGLSLSASASYEVIRNQLYLPARGATPEQILVRQRQLATGYRFNSSFGFSYSFGSIYNNVVNTRF